MEVEKVIFTALPLPPPIVYTHTHLLYVVRTRRSMIDPT